MMKMTRPQHDLTGAVEGVRVIKGDISSLLLKELDPYRAAGADGIRLYVLKDSAGTLDGPPEMLFRNSPDEGSIPTVGAGELTW